MVAAGKRSIPFCSQTASSTFVETEELKMLQKQMLRISRNRFKAIMWWFNNSWADTMLIYWSVIIEVQMCLFYCHDA